MKFILFGYEITIKKNKATEQQITKNVEKELSEKPGYYKFLSNQRIKYIFLNIDNESESDLFIYEYEQLIKFYNQLNKVALKNDDLALDIFKEHIPKELINKSINKDELLQNRDQWRDNYKLLRNVIKKLKLRYAI